jgi:hypothetical protein
MATRRNPVVSELGKEVTPELFLEFVKQDKTLASSPFYMPGDSSWALMAATYLLNTLVRLNDYLLEKEKNERT